jgi:hypothetical protein
MLISALNSAQAIRQRKRKEWAESIILDRLAESRQDGDNTDSAKRIKGQRAA